MALSPIAAPADKDFVGQMMRLQFVCLRCQGGDNTRNCFREAREAQVRLCPSSLQPIDRAEWRTWLGAIQFLIAYLKVFLVEGLESICRRSSWICRDSDLPRSVSRRAASHPVLDSANSYGGCFTAPATTISIFAPSHNLSML